MKNSSVIDSYRPSAAALPAALPPPAPALRDYRRLVAIVAVVLLPVLAGASLWYGLNTLPAAPVTRPEGVEVWGSNGTLYGVMQHGKIAGQPRVWLQPYSALYWSDFRSRGCAQCHDSVTSLRWGDRGRR